MWDGVHRQAACLAVLCPSRGGGFRGGSGQPAGRLRPRGERQAAWAWERVAWCKKLCWGRPCEWGKGRPPETGSAQRTSGEIRARVQLAGEQGRRLVEEE
jgi:hypothetical protein